MALVYAVMHLYNILSLLLLLLSIPLKEIILFLKSGIDGSTGWFAMPTCPGLVCFFNGDGAEGTSSSRVLCSMFVRVFCYVGLCTGLVLWF